MSDSEEQARVSIRILEKEYFIVCKPSERDDLLQSAQYLNAKMKEIRDTGKVVGLDRIAVIAALNMANELSKLNAQVPQSSGQLTTRVNSIRERVERALDASRQLEL
jgi:cell division protein ZapA